MKLNLTEHRRMYADAGPYKVLAEAELQQLRDGDTNTVAINVTAETMALICELGARYRLYSLVYYRTAATVENITIYGKQGSAGFYWEELPTVATASTVSVDFSTTLGHFEQIKIIHTVITGTANVREVEVWSEDEHVLFGPTGTASVFSVDSGTLTLLPEAVQIFNPETIQVDCYCVLDSTSANVDGMTLGATYSGTFYGLYEAGVSLPTHFPWANGSLQNVVEVGNTLVIVSGTYGVYFTPVIDVNTVAGRRLFWQATNSGTTSIDTPTHSDSVPTIGVRFSDTAPTDGGWVDGQLSVDANWSIVSGTLPFDLYGNDHILRPAYKRYFQAKIEFSAADGDTPILEKLGIEQAIKVTIPPLTYENVYAKSNYNDHSPGRTSGILVWSPENRNIGQ